MGNDRRGDIVNKIIEKDEELLICNKAVNTFGQAIQKVVAMEEMAELAQAISKDLRDKKHNVEEEIADVEIMLSQLKIMYDSNKVEEIKEQKLKRLKELIW